MKRFLSLLLALTMAAALCACGGGKTQSAGNAITVGISADLDTSLDPHVSSSSAGTREVLFNIFEGLVKPDTDGNLLPAVAEKVSVNEAADVYTYTLREGVRFHNGNTVTVGDVVFSLSRAAGLDTGEPLVSDVAAIASVEASNDRDVVVTLKAPDTEFNAKMTVAIVPAGSDPAKDVVGTGPFKFISRVPQDQIVLKRFDDYWGEKALSKTVTLKVIPDAQTMVLSLRSGAVDFANHLISSQVADLGDLTVLEGSSNIIQALYLNNDYEPFRDVRVRQALCYAVDKHAVLDLTVDGHGTAIGSSMLSAMGKYLVPELVDYYSPDPAKAKALLKEAGYENLSFTITVPSNYELHVDTAQVLVEQLRAAGIEAKLDLVEWATWLKEVYQGRNFQATVCGMDSHSLAASGCLARFQSDSKKNFINFSSPAYDDAYARAIAAVDEAEQTALFKQCEEILTKEAANVYLMDPPDYAAMQKNVTGCRFYPALYILDLAPLQKTGA